MRLALTKTQALFLPRELILYNCLSSSRVMLKKIYKRKRCWEGFEDVQPVHFMCITIFIVQWGILYEKYMQLHVRKKKSLK